jgi:hypothetical protein
MSKIFVGGRSFLRPQGKTGMFLQIDVDRPLLNPYPLYHLLTFFICKIWDSHCDVFLCRITPLLPVNSYRTWLDRTYVLLPLEDQTLTLDSKTPLSFRMSVAASGLGSTSHGSTSHVSTLHGSTSHGCTSHETWIFIFPPYTSRCVGRYKLVFYSDTNNCIILYNIM